MPFFCIFSKRWVNPPYVGYQRKFVGWIKRSESTKKRKVSRFKLVAVTGKGDVCLGLASFAGKMLLEKDDGMDAVICPGLSAWKENLYFIARFN